MSKKSDTNFSHTGFVIVRLKSEYEYPKEESLKELSKKYGWEDILDLLPPQPKGINKPKVSYPYITAMTMEELKAAERLAEKSVLPPIRSLTSYWIVDYREEEKIEKGTVRGIANSFNELEQVEIAYPELYAGDPNPVNPDDDPIYRNLLYLNEPLKGMNVSSVWDSTGCSGQGVGFIDLEQGWAIPHQDLPDAELIVFSNAHNKFINGQKYEGNHGTQVLGIVAAKDNRVGGIGIVPNVEYVKLASHYNHSTKKNGFVANAIVKVIKKLLKGEIRAGDVLLLEVQRLSRAYIGGLPTEILPADFDAIRLASALGIVVVEAGGNLHESLDTREHAIWSDYSEHIDINSQDSGAILVAAAHLEGYIYKKINSSTYGRRINCFATTDNIIAPVRIEGDSNKVLRDNYTASPNVNVNSLGATSGASAIISGAAILVQSVYKNKKAINSGQMPLSPLQMRYLLSNYGMKPYVEYTIDSATGDYSYIERPDLTSLQIGVMPDLKKVVENGFQEMPDLHIKRNNTDEGTVPLMGEFTASPDIEVTDNNYNGYRWLNTRVVVRNRSNVDTKFRVDFYIKMGNSALTLQSWHKFSTSYPFEVLGGSTKNLSTIYTIGYNNSLYDFCIMVIVRQAECDNLSLPVYIGGVDFNSYGQLLQSERAFEQFIRNNNSVACRRFTIT